MKVDDNIGVRIWATSALGDIGDTRAVATLVELMEDDDEGIRQSAIVSLGKIGDKGAIAPLIKALSDEDTDVRMSAVKALSNFIQRSDEYVRIREEIKRLIRMSDEKIDVITRHPALEAIVKECKGEIEAERGYGRVHVCPVHAGFCRKMYEIKGLFAEDRVFCSCGHEIESILKEHDLVPVVPEKEDVCSICASIQTCRYGVIDVSDRSNADALYELGMMYALSKSCAILKDENAEESHDIRGIKYIGYKNAEELKKSSQRG